MAESKEKFLWKLGGGRRTALKGRQKMPGGREWGSLFDRLQLMGRLGIGKRYDMLNFAPWLHVEKIICFVNCVFPPMESPPYVN